MNDKIISVHRFKEIDPKTGKEIDLFAIMHEINGNPSCVITDSMDEFKKAFKSYCRIMGYHDGNIRDIVNNGKDKNIDLQASKEEMRKLLSNGNPDAEVNKSDFNFCSLVKKKEVTDDTIDGILSENEVEEKKTKRKKFGNWISQKWKSLKVRAVVVGVAIALAVTGGIGCAVKKNNKHAGKTAKFATINPKEVQAAGKTDSIKETFNENTADFATLLNHTTNTTKKTFMQKFNDFLQYFNGDFAKRHSDYDKEEKLCLSTEGLNAWYMAVNGKDLSMDQITAIYDKTNLDGGQLIDAYKSAYRQLYLAAIVQTEPTKFDTMIENVEGKAFYQNYENQNIQFNLSEDNNEKQQILRDFFTMTFEDFKVNDVENGSARKTLKEMGIENYYSSVLPTINAMREKVRVYGTEIGLSEDEVNEIMGKVDIINDQIMCDLPYQNIRDVADRSQAYQIANPDKTYSDPSHTNFMRAIEEDLTKQGNYNLDKNDISNTNIYQDALSIHLEEQATITTGELTTEKVVEKQWSESSESTRTEIKEDNVSRGEVIAEIGVDGIKKLDQEADEKAGIPQQNEANRQEAEKQADEEAKRQQEEEDKKSEAIDQQIQKEEDQLKQDIDDMNNSDTPIIPSNPNINIDNNNASNITTDPNGTVSGSEELPDPNVTGAEFDKKAEEGNTGAGTSDIADQITEEEVAPYSYNLSQEAIAASVDEMIDRLESGENVDVSYNPETSTVEIVPTIQETNSAKTR